MCACGVRAHARVYACARACVRACVRVCLFVCMLHAPDNNLLFISVFKEANCVVACRRGRAVVVSSAVIGTETIAGATLLTISICLT